jgi:hypothetical protein
VSTGTFLVFEDRPSDSPLVERVWRCHSERAGTFMSVAASHCEMVLTRHRGKMLVTLRGPETRPTTADCPADGEWLGIRFSLGTFLPHHPAATLIDRSDVNLPGATGRSFWLQGSAWEYPDFENAETLVTRLLQAGVLARDQAHLSRSLRRLIGETPARLRAQARQLSFLQDQPGALSLSCPVSDRHFDFYERLRTHHQSHPLPRRLAGHTARATAPTDPVGRPRSGRGVEMEHAGVVGSR